MSQVRPKALPTGELALCEVCRLQPMPESTQHLPFIIAEILCIFLSLKLTIILVCLGYFFSKTIWICPMCKREVITSSHDQSTNQHIIIRLSDCMALVSKKKFRFVAVLIILFTVYLYLNEPSIKPKIQIDKTWKSISANCGFDMYLQNSFKANYFYEKFIDSGKWELKAIFLSRDSPGIKGHVTMKVKMNPSQFSDPEAEDFHVLVIKPQFPLEKGDQIFLQGEWGKRKKHIMVFVAEKLQKTGKSFNPIVFDLLGKGYLREGA